MPYLKCVGGKCDGQFAWCDHHDQHVQVVAHTPLADVTPWTAGAVEWTYITCYIYTYREIWGPNGAKIAFLAPEDWCDMGSIRHQFEK